MKLARADLREVRTDPDFVAVPLSVTELDELIAMWEHCDELSHEGLSIWLKAIGAREVLRLRNRKPRAT